VTDKRTVKQAIERDEKWFADLCERSVELDTTAIKHRVRIEIGEQWLARKLDDTDDGHLADRMRQRTRGELDASIAHASKRPRVFRLHYAAAGAVAIAAMLTLTFSDLLAPATSITSPGSAETLDESYVNAFELYESDAWDTSLAQLSGELDEFDVKIDPADWSDDASGWFETDESDG